MSKLPIVKKTAVPEVAVEISDRVISEEHALECLKRQMGCVELNPNALSDLEDIGIHVKGRGVLKIQRGNAMINQQLLKSIFGELAGTVSLGKKTKKGKRTPLSVGELASLARAAGYLSSKITESQKFSLEMERVRATTDSMTDDDEPATRSFKPGTKVQQKNPGANIIAENVHIHQGIQPALTEGEKV